MNRGKTITVAVIVALVAAASPCLALDLPTESTWGAVVSPDGARAACSYWDGGIGIFDLDSGDLIGLLKGHKTRPSGLAFSADGTTVASADSNKAVILWNLATMKKKASIKAGNEAYSVAFSPDGKYLAVAVKGGGEVYELGAKPKRVGTFPYYTQAETLDTAQFDFADQQVYRSLSFAPDSSYILAAKRRGVHLYYPIGAMKAAYKVPGSFALPESPDRFASMTEGKSGDGAKRAMTVGFYASADGSAIGTPAAIESVAESLKEWGISPSGATVWFVPVKSGSLSLELYRLDGPERLASIPLASRPRAVCFASKDAILWYCDSETDTLVKVDLATGAQLAAIKLRSK